MLLSKNWLIAYAEREITIRTDRTNIHNVCMCVADFTKSLPLLDNSDMHKLIYLHIKAKFKSLN